MAVKIYHTYDEIVKMLDEHNLHTGYYRGSDGKIRFLTNFFLDEQNGEKVAFLQYATEKQAEVYQRTRKLNSTMYNCNITKVIDWFMSADYLGFTPEEAGL